MSPRTPATTVPEPSADRASSPSSLDTKRPPTTLLLQHPKQGGSKGTCNRHPAAEHVGLQSMRSTNHLTSPRAGGSIVGPSTVADRPRPQSCLAPLGCFQFRASQLVHFDEPPPSHNTLLSTRQQTPYDGRPNNAIVPSARTISLSPSRDPFAFNACRLKPATYVES
jgi:hypothetical protein